ncbi:hypothetical protein [Nitrolancea hollandica]|uniref:hypothetical protein n=1 Tax=Nitrolancea hollandica TaxID=1206749 RepID=UPI0002FC8519|nr:hypothetical protein [Nitrolancea hollandica]
MERRLGWRRLVGRPRRLLGVFPAARLFPAVPQVLRTWPFRRLPLVLSRTK